MTLRFQSTLPMRGATTSELFFRKSVFISIHTPHAGSDFFQRCPADYFQISIHTPHAGSDDFGTIFSEVRIYFNPHSPCGERHRAIFLSSA